jgi:hypothetical protein
MSPNMPEGPLRISVVVVNWNTCQLLRACLASLPTDRANLVLETIVVDNGSTDGSPEMVAREFPGVRLVRNDENRGFVKANNQGLRAATGDLLFMLNSDAEVCGDALERLATVLLSDPRIGVVGPRLLYSDGTRQPSAMPFPRFTQGLLPSAREHRLNMAIDAHAISLNEITRVDWLVGAALLFRREVLEIVGPLDERYFMWLDDVDWCQKLRHAGLDRVFVPDAVVIHHKAKSIGQLAPGQFTSQLLDSEYLYLRLHAGLTTTWLVYVGRMLKLMRRWCLGSSPQVRHDAARRLVYHWRNLVKYCLKPAPPAARDPFWRSLPDAGRTLPQDGGDDAGKRAGP